MVAGKSVEYSYPTSDNAKRFGFYQTGCYTVEIKTLTRSKAVAGFAKIEEAKAYAEKLPGEWSTFTR
jgi:hypothetical protein